MEGGSRASAGLPVLHSSVLTESGNLLSHSACYLDHSPCSKKPHSPAVSFCARFSSLSNRLSPELPRVLADVARLCNDPASLGPASASLLLLVCKEQAASQADN